MQKGTRKVIVNAERYLTAAEHYQRFGPSQLAVGLMGTARCLSKPRSVPTTTGRIRAHVLLEVRTLSRDRAPRPLKIH